MSEPEIRALRRDGRIFFYSSALLSVAVVCGFPADVAAPLMIGIGWGLVLTPLGADARPLPTETER